MNQDYKAYFKTFSQVSSAIHSGRETGDILKQIVSHITDIMVAKGCIYWIVNTAQNRIESMISHGFEYRSLALTDYPALLSIFDIHNGREIFIENARTDERIPDLERLGKQRVGSVQGLFFDIEGPYTGILAVYFSGHRPVADEEKELIKALGEQGAIALHKALGYDREKIALLQQVVEGLALALEAKDETTHGHSLKVAELARRTAQAMALTAGEVDIIYHAGLLHDIGKIGMKDRDLDRLGKLSGLEMKRMRKHPVIGARIITPLPLLKEVAPLILHHHERYDGSGYPAGQSGDEILLGARILAVCDVFETMISGRACMKKMTVDDAVVALQEQAGTHFDPGVVQALFKAIETHPEVVRVPDSFRSYMDRIKKNLDTMAGKQRGVPPTPFSMGF